MRDVLRHPSKVQTPLLWASRSSSPKVAHAEWSWLGHRERGCAVWTRSPTPGRGEAAFHELRLSPILGTSYGPSCICSLPSEARIRFAAVRSVRPRTRRERARRALRFGSARSRRSASCVLPAKPVLVPSCAQVDGTMWLSTRLGRGRRKGIASWAP